MEDIAVRLSSCGTCKVITMQEKLICCPVDWWLTFGEWVIIFPFLGAYGPGGNYNVFTGKDASRAIAKWSMAEEDLNDDLVRENMTWFYNNK